MSLLSTRAKLIVIVVIHATIVAAPLAVTFFYGDWMPELVNATYFGVASAQAGLLGMWAAVGSGAGALRQL